MKFTKNKLYLAFGTFMALFGLTLIVLAFAAQGHPAGPIPWVRLGPFGIVWLIGGVAFLFLPTKNK